MRKIRLLLWHAENRFTSRDIFSSKITFWMIFVFSFPEFSITSTILHGNQYYLRHLHSFLASAREVGEDSSWLLCYRAALHGWGATKFHDRCDGQNNTVTIVKKDQYVFGGYTDIPWGKIWYLTINERGWVSCEELWRSRRVLSGWGGWYTTRSP